MRLLIGCECDVNPVRAKPTYDVQDLIVPFDHRPYLKCLFNVCGAVPAQQHLSECSLEVLNARQAWFFCCENISKQLLSARAISGKCQQSWTPGS